MGQAGRVDLLGRMATFVRVVEAGSLSAAATQLHVSAAAVSRQIASLEQDIGTSLLARTTRRMTVTPAGQEYYQRCQRILRDVQDAQCLGRPGEVAGALRISQPVTLGFLTGTALWRPFLAAHPALRVAVRLEDRVVDLVSEDVDVAIRVAAKPPMSTEVVATTLSRWHRVVVASPEHLRRHGTPRSPAALAGHPALSPGRDAATETWSLVSASRTQRVRMSVRCSCSAGHILRDLVLDGVGVALLPHWFVAGDVARGDLVRLLPRWQSEPVVVRALYRAAHRNEPRVRLFLDHLRAAYAASERAA
jgi:DNA-binding transcriptional LysR family regulator